MEFSCQMFFILFKSHEIFMEDRGCLKSSSKAFKNLDDKLEAMQQHLSSRSDDHG
jgi:hypothetical protein